MLRRDYAGQNCSIAATLELIGEQRQKRFRAAPESNDLFRNSVRLPAHGEGGRAGALRRQQERVAARQAAERAELVAGN